MPRARGSSSCMKIKSILLRIVCVPVHTIRRTTIRIFAAVDDQSSMHARVMGPVTSPSDLRGRGGRVRTLPPTHQSFSSLENNSVESNAVTSAFDVCAVAIPEPGDQCASSDIWTASLKWLDDEGTCTDTDDGATSQTWQLQERGDISPGHTLQLARGYLVMSQLLSVASIARCLVRGINAATPAIQHSTISYITAGRSDLDGVLVRRGPA